MKSAFNDYANSRPVIGICARTVPITLQGSAVPVSLAVQSHVDFLAMVGCMPVLVPLLAGVEHIVGWLDGLLVPGGPDVDPARYGADMHPKTKGITPAWDAAELALVERALDTGLPLLAVCRGMQLLNVGRGGTLHQHLPEIIGHDGHCPETESFTLGRQRLNTKAGSRIAAIFAGGAPEITCHHHQAIDRVGTGLVITGRASDGTIEVVEAADHPFAIGVQWEADGTGDDLLYRALADAARYAAAHAVGLT
jgi:putative glutamine amidotransferase